MESQHVCPCMMFSMVLSSTVQCGHSGPTKLHVHLAVTTKMVPATCLCYDMCNAGHWKGPLGPLFEQFGAVKASPMAAFRLLRNNEKVLLFPGGARWAREISCCMKCISGPVCLLGTA